MGRTIRTSLALAGTCALLAVVGCGSDQSSAPPQLIGTAPTPPPIASPPQTIVGISQTPAIAQFSSPWGLAVLPNGAFLVTYGTSPGGIALVSPDGEKSEVSGVPENARLLDIAVEPGFLVTRQIYFTALIQDPDSTRVGRGAGDPELIPERMVAFRAVLFENGSSSFLSDVREIFRQIPTITTLPGSGEPGGRVAFGQSGDLFITSGDRQELNAEFLHSLDNNLGATIRINRDGSIPADNPFVDTPDARPEIWTKGHRNHYGIGFAPDGRLWSAEHGPLGGDEFNLISEGGNYGWPAVSNGSHYGGRAIPDHSDGDGYVSPAITWTPAIAPGGMIFYVGNVFEEWKGDALITGLRSQAIIRVRVDGETAEEVARYDLGARIRDIAEGPLGSLYVVTDGDTGELIRLEPEYE